jgi:hypothetical protein
MTRVRQWDRGGVPLHLGFLIRVQYCQLEPLSQKAGGTRQCGVVPWSSKPLLLQNSHAFLVEKVKKRIIISQLRSLWPWPFLADTPLLAREKEKNEKTKN